MASVNAMVAQADAGAEIHWSRPCGNPLSNGSWNGTGYNNPRVDELTNAFAVETDLAKRDQQIAEAWNIVKDDIVYLPIHHQVIAWGMSDKLTMPIVPNDSPQFRWAVMKPGS